VRSGDGRVGYYSLSCLLGLQLLRCRRRIGSFRVGDLALGESTCQTRPEGQERRSGFAYMYLLFCFYDGDERVIVSKKL